MANIKFILTGIGGEVVLGKITKKCAEFWQSEEMSDYFYEYVRSPEWFAEENSGIKIPKYATLGNWYEHDDRGHECGVYQNAAQLEIVEMDGIGWEANELDNIYYGNLLEFIEDHNEEGNMVQDEEIMPKSKEYTLTSVHTEKGTFYEGTIDIEGKFDPSKVAFDICEINDDILVTGIYYDGEYIDNTNGGGTDGKSLDHEIVEPWESK
jgi:hypothetical protein